MADIDPTTAAKRSDPGKPHTAEELMRLMYDRFRELADHYIGQFKGAATLQPTELVHEMFLKVARPGAADWKGRSHFFAVGATAMRQILVDRARARLRSKRGGGRVRVVLDESLSVSREREHDVLALDEILGKLEKLNARHARIVELRFFGGLTIEEAAEVLQVSKRTVEADWTLVRAWLRRELGALCA